MQSSITRVFLLLGCANSQLVPGGSMVPGGGGRARQYGYVREPGQGFWVSGSAFEEMSGVYIRDESVPAEYTRMHTWGVQLFYRNPITKWAMALVKSPPPDEWEEEGYEPINQRGTEWVIMDANGRDIVAHEGESILPGCCTRWKRVQREPEPAQSTPEQPQEAHREASPQDATQRASVSPSGEAAPVGAGAGVAANSTACMWRQTGGCAPDGEREPEGDKACDATVPRGASGYCECGGEAAAEDSGPPAVRVRQVGCDHAPFTCAPSCARVTAHAMAGGELSTFVEEDGAAEEEAYLREAELPWQAGRHPPTRAHPRAHPALAPTSLPPSHSRPHPRAPWLQVVMLGDPRRMRNIEFHNQRWWDRMQAERRGAQAQDAPRAAREAAEAAAAAAAGPDELVAVEAMGEGRHEDALEALRRLLAPEGESAGWGAPARARAVVRRAACLRRLHRLEEAFERAREAHELDAASPLVLFERGATLLDLGR